MDQGALHEAFNMAGLWKLPVIYVVENNLMSMGTQLHRHSAVLDLTHRGGPPYGFPGVAVDANDVEAMAETVREAADRARAGEGPTFIEAKTYRYRGHSMSDPMKYRTKEELEQARTATRSRSTRSSSATAAGSTTRASSGCRTRSRS